MARDGLSGDGLPQQEVSVLLPADDAVHLEGIGGGVGVGHHVALQFLERPLAHQLHSHWSDAAFQPEGLINSGVLLKTLIQLRENNNNFFY